MSKQKSCITVKILFSYKGENYAPAATIELDSYLEKKQPVPDFFHLLARENNIDVYSYQYEVMQMGQYVYSDASGLAAEFCQQDRFDMAGFVEKWNATRVLDSLSTIAREHLGEKDLEQNQALKSALLQAYQLGLKK